MVFWLMLHCRVGAFNLQVGSPFAILGNKSNFVVTLSVEVNDGILIASLPTGLLHTAELKIKGSYHWQHLQSFVTISKHFTIKGKGIRIRGTVEECNNALQQLLYQGVIGGVILTVTVNDMGNYGRNADYVDKVSLPLSAEAVINIIKRRPISSVAAHCFRSVVVCTRTWRFVREVYTLPRWNIPQAFHEFTQQNLPICMPLLTPGSVVEIPVSEVPSVPKTLIPVSEVSTPIHTSRVRNSDGVSRSCSTSTMDNGICIRT